MMMVVSPNTHDSDSSLTQRCNIVLFGLAECMYVSTQVMASCPWMSFVRWWEGKERLSPSLCIQPTCHQAILATPMQSPPLHGGHTRSAYHLLHTQCCRLPVARARQLLIKYLRKVLQLKLYLLVGIWSSDDIITSISH